MAHLDLILLVAAVNHTVSESGGKKKEKEIKKKNKTLHSLTRWSAKNFSSRSCALRHIKNTSE